MSSSKHLSSKMNSDLLLNCEFIICKDGSPTLKFDKTEPMHSLSGAFSETIYIYKPAIEHSIKLSSKPPLSLNCLSVGLGLAYNEILATCMEIEHSTNIKIISLESSKQLQENFKNWILFSYEKSNNTDTNTNLKKQKILKTNIENKHIDIKLNENASLFYKNYDNILGLFSEHFNIPTVKILTQLNAKINENSLLLLGALNSETIFTDQFDIILYDAYSNNTSQDLWTEEFLNQFLTKSSSDCCSFATYAATGACKRALKLNGFKLQPKTGYAGKRESILAFKT